MSILITDAIQRATDGFSAIPTLSADGKKAYIVYQINVNDQNQKAAELFKVVNNRLVSLATYNPPSNTEFSSISSGFADRNFDLFTIMQDNQKEGLEGRFQINTLVYDGTSELKVKNSLVVPAYVPGYTAYGGSFVDNDRSIVITAAVENAPVPGGNQTSSIWLLSRTLEVQDVKTREGIFTSSANAFSVCGVKYFSICTAFGSLDFNNVTKAWRPPFALEVYSVARGKFTFVKGTLLPMGSLYGNVFSCGNKAVITVGTYAALKANVPSLLVKTDDASEYGSNLSAIPNSTGELRTYRFANGKLRLRSAENFDGNVESAYTTSAFSITGLGTGPYSTFSPSMVRVHEFCSGSISSLLATSNTPLFSWSEDESLFLLASGDTQNSYNNNIALLKISQ